MLVGERDRLHATDTLREVDTRAARDAADEQLARVGGAAAFRDDVQAQAAPRTGHHERIVVLIRRHHAKEHSRLGMWSTANLRQFEARAAVDAVSSELWRIQPSSSSKKGFMPANGTPVSRSRRSAARPA